ncbi:MAG TPA: MBG domain-containing protein, partial [Burkholderiales bacterium]|nr:MBG domain-containing protein [Burkholderiales bacterium]
GKITLASLTRVPGETVGGSPYSITGGSAGGTAIGNYTPTVNTNGHVLNINPVALTGTIANQSKTYGSDDPALASIAVALGGVVNANVTDWNGNVTSLNDTGNVATTLASLTRVPGELVSGSPYAITAAGFNALTGSAAGNYNAPSFSGSPTLTISKANLTGSIASQSKVYGTDDPALGGIGVTLSGLVNNPSIVTWNGVVSVDDSAVTGSLTSLTRQVGENVGLYNITNGAVTLSASNGNYNKSFDTSNNPALSITKAGTLTGTIANQTKAYGMSDPSAGTIPVSLSGQVNTNVTDWNGNVTAINDTTPGKVTATLASITRNAGENVGNYSYTGGVLNPLGGSSAGNYAGASFNPGASMLDITPGALTVKADNESKLVGNTFIFTGSEFTSAGLQFGETIGSVTLTSTGAPAPAPAGTYPIVPSAATGGTFSASNYNISYANGLMTVTSVNPPPPPLPLPSANNLEGSINPILVGLQSLGIAVPPITYEALDCIGHSLDSGAVVNNGVAVSLPRRCVSGSRTNEIYDVPHQTIRFLILGELAGDAIRE